MPVSLDQFGKALVASGLFTSDDVKAFWNGLPAEGRPKDGEGFAKLLVERGRLTDFQAKRILAGEGKSLVMGDYTVLQEIGAGGMGQVYKARHRRMDRIVALKVMSAAAMKDDAAVKRFQREVRAAARLEHPNIVTAYDSGESGNVKYLVMQFVDGGDLTSLVKAKGPLEIERAVNFVIQAARGLSFAHGEGVIHRDVKPANLLVDKKGVVKILDMGLARFEDGGDGLTATEQVMGTVDYMSPEQAANTKGADGRSDIYSLGCTLWYLLTGKKTYDGDTMIARLMAHRDAPLPSLVKARDDAPWALEQVLHKMLAKRPQDRYQTMDEVIAALEAFAGGGSSILPGSAGKGSSIGGGSGKTQNAEFASFLEAMQPGTKTQTSQPATAAVPSPSNTAAPVEVTQAFQKPEADTDPKSDVMLAPTAVDPQKAATAARAGGAKSQAKRGGGKGKKPPTKLIAVGLGGAALLVALGIWVIVKNPKGETVATIKVPENGIVEVITDPNAAPNVVPPKVEPAATPSVPSFMAAIPPASDGIPPPGDYALKFGVGQSVSIPTPALDPRRSFTFEAYVTYPSDSNNRQWAHIYFTKNQATLQLQNTGSCSWAVRTLAADGSPLIHVAVAPFPLDRRTHVAAVRTEQELRLYFDGRLAASTSIPAGDLRPAESSAALGGGTGSNGAFDGIIDELRISQSERYVGEFTPAPRHEPDADTLALYHFDEGIGDVLNDSSGNNYHGKITGARWVRVGSPATQAADVVYLDDLPEQSYVGLHNRLFKPGRNADDAAAFAKVFLSESPVHTLMMHPAPANVSPDLTSRAVYDLAGGYSRFHTQFRVRARVRSAPIVAEVWGDGKQLWQSGDLVPRKVTGVQADVDVGGVRELTLVVRAETDADSAHTLLIEPRLTPVQVPSTKTTAAPASTAPPGRRVDLLPLVDVAQDKMQGSWEMRNGELHTGRDAGPLMLEFPYQPPEEYDFIIEFTYAAGGEVHQFLARQGRGFSWALGAMGYKFSGFERIDGKVAHENPTRRDYRPKFNERHISRVEVRNDGLRAYLDGNLIGEWKGDYKQLDAEVDPRWPFWKRRDPSRLAIGTKETPTIFHQAGVVEIRGRGKFLRPDASVIPPATSGASNAAPVEALTFHGHSYLFVADKLAWDEAKTRAEQMGGHLVTITTAEENDWVARQFVAPRGPGIGVWLGGMNDGVAGR